MNSNPILIIAGEPFSIFSEILFKSFKKNKFSKPLILIGSFDLLKKQMKHLNFNIPFNQINKDFNYRELKKNKINIINVNFRFKKIFQKINNSSNSYNQKCFDLALQLIKKRNFAGLINGPISKRNFLRKKFLGITEYMAKKTSSKNYVMLIFNNKLSVSPLTTHIPLKDVSKSIKKKNIINHVILIKSFYKKYFKKDPVVAITGLNPHCESNYFKSEEDFSIKPAIKELNKTYSKIYGPYSADSLFMKNNIKKFDVIVGMYHDQVLSPIKTLKEYDAINITLGLPFFRISPDHGPNEKMINKNLSNPLSLIRSLKFLDKQ